MRGRYVPPIRRQDLPTEPDGRALTQPQRGLVRCRRV